MGRLTRLKIGRITRLKMGRITRLNTDEGLRAYRDGKGYARMHEVYLQVVVIGLFYSWFQIDR